MSALFNFHSFLTVVLLWICTCTYVKMHFPALLEQRTGYLGSTLLLLFRVRLPPFLKCFVVYALWFRGFFWKAARIGERLSPWMAVGCLTMGVSIIFF